MVQYLKPDSELGYIEDTAEIEFLKFNNLRHSVLGCMLGDFDERGSYIVSPEIRKELISMEKYIVQTYDNIELCKSTLRLDKQISFMVTFEGNKATLSLVEKLNYEANFTLNSGVYSNINEYVLDSVETSGEVNRNMIYARWNIKTAPSNIIDIFNCDDSILEKYFGLVNRFKYLLKANTIMLEKEAQLEDIEASYSNAILEILSHYPALKKEVMDNIAEELKEKKDSISVNKPYFAKTFNELLENAISKKLGVLNEKEQVEFKQEKRNATVELNIKRQNTFELEQVETNEKQETPKIFQIKFTQEDQRKPLIDHAQDLVRENKRVTERVSGGENSHTESALFRRTILVVSEKKGNIDELPEEIKNTPEEFGEREKLIQSLVKEGLGELINKTKKEETKTEDKTTKQEKNVKAETKKATANNKKTENKAKKPTATKKADAKKSAKKKKADKEKKKEDEEVKPEKTRLLAESYFAKSTETESKTKKPIKQTEDITILSTDELEHINKKINKETKTTAKVSPIVEEKVDVDVKVVEVDASIKVEKSGMVELLNANTSKKASTTKRARLETINPEMENLEDLNNLDTI